jgi:hypothetical protein
VNGLTRSRKIASWMLLLVSISMATGCVGLAAQILYVWKGTSVPAECRDLENMKVAVICVTNEGYFDRSGADELSRAIEQNLKKNVKGMKLVPHKEVADWIDNNDAYNLDPKAVGKAIKCDRVLYVEIRDFSISEGETLFRGKATWKAIVYDIPNDDRLDQTGDKIFKFPTHTERPKIDQPEELFHQEFVLHLARVIARRYHTFDKLDDIAGDTPSSTL